MKKIITPLLLSFILSCDQTSDSPPVVNHQEKLVTDFVQLTENDLNDDEECPRNPQRECSAGDGGAACLRNYDNQDCCGGICLDLGADGECPPCVEG